MTTATMTIKSITTASSTSSCQRASAIIPYPVVYNNDTPQQTNKTTAKRRTYKQIHQSTSPTPSSLPHTPHSQTQQRTCQPLLIATISAGFDKGDYLIREERGQNVYFDFFEEAYNYATTKGFTRMSKHEEDEYMSIVRRAHKSVPGGIRYNTGRLLMVLCKRLVPLKPIIVEEEEEEPNGYIIEEGSYTKSCSSADEHVTNTKKDNRRRQKLKQSTNTLPTDSESDSCTSRSFHSSTRASSARQSSFSTSTSYVDSWE